MDIFQRGKKSTLFFSEYVFKHTSHALGGSSAFNYNPDNGVLLAVSTTAAALKVIKLSGSPGSEYREPELFLSCPQLFTSWVNCVRWSRDDHFILASTEEKTHIYDVLAHKKLSEIPGDMPRGITISRNNPSIAYVAESKGLRNVDFRTSPSSSSASASSFILPAAGSPFIDVQVASDDFASSMFITAHMDGTVRFHDSRQTASPLLSLITNESKKHAASCVRLDSRQSRLAINTEIPDEGLFVVPLHSIISSLPSSSSALTISDLQESGYLRVVKGSKNKSYLKNCEFLTDDFIIAGSDDGRVRIWDIDSGAVAENMGTIDLHRPVVNVAVPPPEAYHPNLPHFFAFSNDNYKLQILSADLSVHEDETVMECKELAADIDAEERELALGEAVANGDTDDDEEEEWRNDPLNLPNRQCSYSFGYPPRQQIFVCKTCAHNRQSSQAQASSSDPDRVEFQYSNGICTQCAIHCHERHDLVELGARVSFKCDCGTEKLVGRPCSLSAEPRPSINDKNIINHNFAVPERYCVCDGSADSVNSTMIQCKSKCSDWFHVPCIRLVDLANDAQQEYPPVICNSCFDKYFSFLHRYPLETCLGRDSQFAFALSEALKQQEGELSPFSSASSSSSAAIGRRTPNVTLLSPDWGTLLTAEEVERVDALAPPRSWRRDNQANAPSASSAGAIAASSSSSKEPEAPSQPSAADEEEKDVQAYIQAFAQRDTVTIQRMFVQIVMRRTRSVSDEHRRATVTRSDMDAVLPAVRAMLEARTRQFQQQQQQQQQQKPKK